MNFRFRFETLGGHTHAVLFVGKDKDYTHANSGRIVLSNEEWRTFRDTIEVSTKDLLSPTFEFLEHNPHG
jgi:hypothetical protein